MINNMIHNMIHNVINNMIHDMINNMIHNVIHDMMNNVITLIASGSPPDASICSVTVTPESTLFASNSSGRNVPDEWHAKPFACNHTQPLREPSPGNC